MYFLADEFDALQFGHGGEAVETDTKVAAGNAMTDLQFGHGGEAVETKV